MGGGAKWPAPWLDRPYLSFQFCNAFFQGISISAWDLRVIKVGRHVKVKLALGIEMHISIQICCNNNTVSTYKVQGFAWWLHGGHIKYYYSFGRWNLYKPKVVTAAVTLVQTSPCLNPTNVGTDAIEFFCKKNKHDEIRNTSCCSKLATRYQCAQVINVFISRLPKNIHNCD